MFDGDGGGGTVFGVSLAPAAGRVSLAERIERIWALEQQLARFQAAQAQEVAAFASGRIASDRAGGCPSDQAGRGAAAEVGLARGVSPTTAQYQLTWATALVEDHPGVFAALSRGDIALSAARGVVDETAVLGSDLRRLVDAELAAHIDRQLAGSSTPPRPTSADDGWAEELALEDAIEAGELQPVAPERPPAVTPGRLRSTAAHRVIAADAAAAEERTQRARRDRRVSMFRRPDAAAALHAELPAEHAAACWHALDHHARLRYADGDPRTLAQLMADTLVERITGLTAGQRPDPHHSGTGVSSETDATSETADPGNPGPGVPAQVGVVVRLSTLLGEDDEPATMAGYGPVPASVARDLADRPASRIRRWVLDRAGRVTTIDTGSRRLDGDLASYRSSGFVTDRLRRLRTDPANSSVHDIDTDDRLFGGPVRRYLYARDQVCRMPTCTGAIRDADHVRPYGQGGRTRAGNGHGLSRRCHHVRDLPGWHLSGDANDTVVWTTPTGHRYVSRPPPVFEAGEPP